MKKNIIKIAGLVLASALALSARADVAIHQNVSLYGYVAGSIQTLKGSESNYNSTPDTSKTNTDIDAAKLGLAFNFAPLTAKVSIYAGHRADDVNILEANASYDLGEGISITGGRFQSWIGYEAFDIPNGNFISNGADILSHIIPNFHEGLRVDYTVDKMSFGVAVVNSVYNLQNEYRGDGSLSDGYGVEGHFGYNDGPLSLGATLAYQNTREINGIAPSYDITLFDDTYIADVWAQYVIKQTTIAAELFYLQTRFNGGPSIRTYYGLVMVKQQINEKLSVAGRFSAGQEKSSGKDKSNFWKISAQPAYTITKNLSVGAEISYTKYNSGTQIDYGTNKDKIFAGVQAIFAF